MGRLERLRARVEGLFPERHLYLRSGGEMRAFVLSRRRQMTVAGVLGAAGLWMGVCTAAMVIQLARPAEPARAIRPQVAAVATPGPGEAAALVDAVEKRHAALALLLSEAKDAPGAAQALTPPIAHVVAAAAPATDPLKRLQAVQASQEQVVTAADALARSRAERLRKAFRLAGVSPASAPAPAGAAGGPLIEARDPRALAAALKVDEPFAARLQSAASEMFAANALAEAAGRLPLARPTQGGAETSGFGIRTDPFTGAAAFHPGLDFAGSRMTPVLATAPGVVAFTGVRPGYGQTVEVDHGKGFKTRYAHLARISVRPGQRVAAGTKLGGMGSTGRSTGTHLHYEVWLNGRAQNPERFVRAGAVARAG